MRGVLPLLFVLGSCSFLVQNHLPSEYSGNSEPMCDTGKGPVVVDAVLAVLNIGATILIAAAPDDGTPGRSDAIAGGIIDGAAFLISGLAGNSWANECRDARAHWNDAAEEQRRHDEAREKAELRREAVTPKPDEHVARGFFCAASVAQQASGLCTRDKSDCVRARDAVVGIVGDLGECTLQETAWCISGRCTPSESACEARRAQAGSDALDCREER